jgi:hypothetical protein
MYAHAQTTSSLRSTQPCTSRSPAASGASSHRPNRRVSQAHGRTRLRLRPPTRPRVRVAHGTPGPSPPPPPLPLPLRGPVAGRSIAGTRARPASCPVGATTEGKERTPQPSSSGRACVPRVYSVLTGWAGRRAGAGLCVMMLSRAGVVCRGRTGRGRGASCLSERSEERGGIV